jgi:hypothetical protein
MSVDYAAYLDELAGRSEWVHVWCQLEEDPVFSSIWRFGGQAPPWLTLKTGHTLDRERFLAFRAGTPAIEARNARSAEYKLLPQGFLLCGWYFGRDRRRLRAIDRDGNEFGPDFFDPRTIDDDAQKPERVVAQVNATKKPPYRSLSKGVYAAIVTYEKELSEIILQKDQAAFLAEKIGCSQSLAAQILGNEKKK